MDTKKENKDQAFRSRQLEKIETLLPLELPRLEKLFFFWDRTDTGYAGFSTG
ncbi:hypothetical protein RWE15_23455 [Virgibacillus halophilus]|uniref:Uncharacterized protein n=1 Tax=Tigheibacillus halophilus TaxID=361280 RepID=A0ABU5CBK1_9BACI|nr:hypothetical protein [Virgibacillus halophilus]